MPSSDYVEKVWGIEGCEEIRVSSDYAQDYDSVFPRESKKITIVEDVSSAYTERRGNSWIMRYAEIAQSAFELGRLSTLVCCPSYSIAGKIHDELKATKYLETRETSIEDVMEAVSSSKLIIVAVARGKILEGVELVKDGASLIDSVVIAGVRIECLTSTLQMESEERDGKARSRPCQQGVRVRGYFMRSPALIIVRSGHRRAVRFPGDSATVYLADRRFRDQFWSRMMS